jgi:hypothetical protein
MTETEELLERFKSGLEALIKLSEKELTGKDLFLFNYYRSKTADNLCMSTYYYAAWHAKEHAPSLDYLYELTKDREELTHKLELFNLGIRSNDIEVAIKIAIGGIYQSNSFFSNYFTLLGISLAYKHNRLDLITDPFFYGEDDLRYKLNDLVY